MITFRRQNELWCALRKSLVIPGRKVSAQNLPATFDAEYTTEATYPEIKDLSFKAKKQREEEKWHESIKRAPTVEEKLIKVNMPRYYGYKVVKFSDEKFPYNCLPAMQHYTRTSFEKIIETTNDDIKTKEKVDLSVGEEPLIALVQVAKSDIQDALEFTYDYLSHKIPSPSSSSEIDPMARERIFTQMVVEQINRVLVNALAVDFKHLNEIEIDYNPRHEAFWQVGGIDAPKNVIKSKEGREWQKSMAKDPVDRLMQYNAEPYLALRHRKQLSPWKSLEEANDLKLAEELPRFKYDPRTLGFLTGYQHGTNIPGFWPGSASVFGCLSYQSRVHMQLRPDSYGADDFKEVLHAQAILSSYAWLLAQANYNGFNTYSELTYPMNTQTIITNGRDWSFYEYQLNTLLLHSRHIDENPKVNFCRGTDELQLYQEFDSKGKCVGLNENVIKHLLKFYTNVPSVERSKAELQPFLNQEHSIVADYPLAEQRVFLEKTFKHLVANRPRHLAIPEIYLWEKIYKIDHKTRPMEAKRRFFEVGINPWKRTLDQHQKEYIPRVLRANGPKDKKNKWKKTYYPKERI